MPRHARLSLSEARRLALAAQGFGAARPANVGAARLRAVLRRTALVQIDSVNVLARSHYLPFFSRLGGYDRTLLDRSAWGRRSHRRLFEYWGHEASLLPVELHPLLRWRMARAERGEGIYRSVASFSRERRAFIEEIAGELARRGPLSASDLQAARPGKGSWWGWSDGKMALEWLFWAGRVTTATRRSAGFERVYDLPERVLPSAVLAASAPAEADAQRELLSLAARALGIATESDLRDYFRLPPGDAKARLRELVEGGRLAMATVEGWERPAYLDPAARIPRDLHSAALLSPFDSLIWERARAERLFGFHYRIEIYTPAARRRYGYYVLPFLLGERLVGRVDLKADRAGRRLVVQAAFAEPGTDAPRAAAALPGVLRALARWLGLEEVYVAAKGDLAAAVRRSRPSGRFPS
jgi:uncharacterized protein